MKSTMLRSVQALRGLAALSVMLFHFRWNLNSVYPGSGDALFSWGATGVDLFFLISGFVITLSIKKITPDFRGMFTFFKHRALRILPAYFTILLVTFFLSGAMSTFHYPDKTANFISALTFQPLYTSNGPFYVDDSGMYGIRWTLNYEIYFYIAIGLFIAAPVRWISKGVFFAFTLIILPMLMGNDFTLSPAGYQTGIAQLNLITNPIIFLFLAGMLVGIIYPFLIQINGTLMSYLLMCTLIITFLLFREDRFVGHGLMSSGWLYLLILIFAVGAEKTTGKFIPAALIKLGDISFSLYLIHTLMNTGIGKRFNSLGIEAGPERFLVSCVLSLLLAWLSWRFIEQPFLLKNKKSLSINSPSITH